MNQETSTTILVAISLSSMSDIAVRILEHNEYAVYTAQSPEHAFDLMDSYHIDGIVMTSNWVTISSKKHAKSLIEIAKKTIPSLTIVLQHNRHIYDKIYFPGKNEYMRTPIDFKIFLGYLEDVLKSI